jgi:hypothetical protein
MKPSTYLLFAVNYLGLASAASIPNPDNGLAPMEKRGCFATGISYGNDKKNAISQASKACNGPLKGKYSKRETSVKCYNISSNKHVIFTVGLTGPNANADRNLDYQECYNGLKGRIEACPKGDDHTYGHWRYR